MSNKPTLRPLDFQSVVYEGQQMWFLRDPLQLSDYQVIIPPPLAQMLLFCDGSHTPLQIHEAFCQHIGGHVDYKIVTDTLAQLDAACLLDNDTAQAALQKLKAQYRAQSHRPPALADLSYPADQNSLIDLFHDYANGSVNGQSHWQGRGIVSPHIDYQRGGPVYAQVWHQAQATLLEAEMVIILGTDHNGGAGTFTLTRLPYATPFGVLPTDLDLIDKLAEAIGPEAAYAEELHHRAEHSVELSAVWMHYIYHQANVPPPPMIPILIGSFYHFVSNGGHPAHDALLTTAIRTLQAETADKKVVIVASVDLAHVGPAFGDRFSMDQERRMQLRQEDGRLMEAILRGDAATFYDRIATVKDRNRICGFSPIYLMLRYLTAVTGGTKIDYAHCAADPQDHSLVSICGLLLD